MAQVIDKYGGLINNTGKDGGTVSNGVSSTSWENYMKAKAYGGGQREVNTKTGNVTSKDGKEIYGNIYGGVANPNYTQYKNSLNNNNNPDPVYYDSSSGGGDDGSSARLQALRDAIEQARQNALNSNNKAYNTSYSNLKNQAGLLEGNYQALIDQNEVDYRKMLRSMRLNQSNLGQLDSGFGRQAMLEASTKNSQNKAGILAQREADRTAIRNMMEQLQAEREQKNAEINNQYNNSQLQLM